MRWSRTKALVVVYLVVLATAIVMAWLHVLGLLSVLLLIAASCGILHLAYIKLFAAMPDYLAALKEDHERRDGPR